MIVFNTGISSVIQSCSESSPKTSRPIRCTLLSDSTMSPKYSANSEWLIIFFSVCCQTNFVQGGLLPSIYFYVSVKCHFNIDAKVGWYSQVNGKEEKKNTHADTFAILETHKMIKIFADLKQKKKIERKCLAENWIFLFAAGAMTMKFNQNKRCLLAHLATDYLKYVNRTNVQTKNAERIHTHSHSHTFCMILHISREANMWKRVWRAGKNIAERNQHKIRSCSWIKFMINEFLPLI